MSRLDSMIRRLEAQRDGVAWAALKLVGVPGDILEIGLGNGRTYDHLRETFPDREIWVIDRAPKPASGQRASARSGLLAMEADAALGRIAGAGACKIALGALRPGRRRGGDVDRPLAAGLSPLDRGAARARRAGVVEQPPGGAGDRGRTGLGGSSERYFFYRKE